VDTTIITITTIITADPNGPLTGAIFVVPRFACHRMPIVIMPDVTPADPGSTVTEAADSLGAGLIPD
jgi:hypothetical protein